MTTYTGPERRMTPRIGWRSSSLGIFLGRLWSLVAYSDTTPTRFLLALAGAAWALFLFAPGDTFTRPVYRYMAIVAGDNAEAKWAVLWALYSIGMFCRVFSSTQRPRLSLAIHVLGMLLYWGTTVSIYFTLTFPLPAALATDIILSVAAGWVLVRTGVNSEGGWRRD